MPADRTRTLLLTAALLAAVGPAAATPSRVLHLVDDRGLPIGEALDVCFQLDLRNDCRRAAAGETVEPPPAFHSIRVEGNDHGPLSLRREAVHARPDGSILLVVPRKALLRIVRKDPRRPLTLSGYRPDDPTFREPTFRATLAPGQDSFKAPAGDFVLSLTAQPDAPDLQRLAAKPGATAVVSYHSRSGWSLLIRCRTAAELSLLTGARIEIGEVRGYGLPEHSLAAASSGADGLALVSGLGAAMASLKARHASFVDAEVGGLTASPGTFAFREVAFAPGGRLAAHVTVHGRPLAGARCQIFALAPDASEPRRDPYRQLWEGSTGEQGMCRSAPLAQGLYKLRVLIPGSSSEVNVWVNVPASGDVDEDVALAPTRVFGEVRRDGKAVQGYRVDAFPIDFARPREARGDVAARATTGEDGRYEMTLWTPGWYGLMPRSPAGSPSAAHRDLTVDGDEERRVDFDLQATSFHGRVTDEDERPVESARVALRWHGILVADTDALGRFAIDVAGEGTGILHAMKPGYREADPVEVPVKEDVAIPSVTLVLKRKGTVRGQVLSAAGSPVANAWIGSAGSSLEQGPFLFAVTRTGADGGFEVETPPGPPQVFVSGPRCPLSRFALVESDPPATLRCPEAPAALELILQDDQGRPLPHAAFILRHDGAVVPRSVLATHLQLLGLPAETDGTGHLVLAGLGPGDYELFLNTLSSESTVAAGLRTGYLTAISLPALQTTELLLTMPGSPDRAQPPPRSQP